MVPFSVKLDKYFFVNSQTVFIFGVIYQKNLLYSVTKVELHIQSNTNVIVIIQRLNFSMQFTVLLSDKSNNY